MASRTLLFEIGCEEVPAKMLARALAELPAQATALLAKASLQHGEVRAIGTPRRLALIVSGLHDATAEVNEELVGPPVAIAFDAEGKPTKAGVAFATKSGVSPEALRRGPATGPGAKKGEFALATKIVAAQPAMSLLPLLLAQLAGGIAWPKSQRWGWADATFVRPMQWLCALYGADVVPVTFAGVTAGGTTRGHRFLAPEAHALASADAYVDTLRRAFVIVDGAERRQLVEAELVRAAAETGTRLRPDDGLLDEVVNLVEYPVAIAGGFDAAFLEVPAEVIVTAMRTHQRYFALERADGTLAPGFVTVAGSVTRTKTLVQAGNERVLAARLSDARFFFAEDRKKPNFMLAWNERLGSVVFQAKLGEQARTIGHKIARIERSTRKLAEWIDASTTVRSDAIRAATLCKSDLASGVVGEFPELQGVMGMHYARLAGEPEGVALAIAEHYLPKGQVSEMPSSLPGVLVGLADRMDTLVACFATGQVPTGSADPFGLRRAAIGVLQLLLHFDLRHSANEARLTIDLLVATAAAAFEGSLQISDAHKASLTEFMKVRLRGLLVEQGIAASDADATLAKFDNRSVPLEPRDARARAASLRAVSPVARALFKRMANIVEETSIADRRPPTSSLFRAPVETALWTAFQERKPRIEEAVRNRQYGDVFQCLVELEPMVSAYFDRGGVMVMDPDLDVRANRLGMLVEILGPFDAIADFRLLAQPAAGAGA